MSAVKNDVLLPEQVRGYIGEHRLDAVLTAALNGIIRQMPTDPFAHLAEELAKHSPSAPHFVALQKDELANRSDLRVEVLVFVRGVRIRIYSLALGGLLLTPAEAGTQPAAPGVEAEAILASYIQDWFAKNFSGCAVDDVLTFHRRFAGLAEAPVPAGWAVDLTGSQAALTEELLSAGALSVDGHVLQLFQQALGRSNASHLQSARLKSLADAALWRELWPRLALPLMRGGKPGALQPTSLRLFAASTPFLAGAVSEEAPDCPALGWVATNAQTLQTAAAEVIKLLQAEKAPTVADGFAYGHPSGLAGSIELAKKAIEAAAPGKADQVCGVLKVVAQEAWLEEEGLYEVEAGKKLTLEELVALYAAVTEDGWVKALVQPFRAADGANGCEMLLAQRPDLVLVQDLDFGPPPSKCGSLFVLGEQDESLPAALQRYVEQSTSLQELGQCTELEASAVAAFPSALAALVALSPVQFICLGDGVKLDDVQKMSGRIDEVLQCVLCHSPVE